MYYGASNVPATKDPEKQSFFKGPIKLYFKLQALDCNLKMFCVYYPVKVLLAHGLQARPTQWRRVFQSTASGRSSRLTFRRRNPGWVPITSATKPSALKL